MDYLLFTITVICVWVLVSLATNLVIGHAGMFSMGHVGYMGIGAYTVAILNILLGVNYFIALPAAIIATALFAVATLLPLLRLSRFHFGLATLGMNVVITDMLHNVAPRSTGAEGLFGFSVPDVMNNTASRLAIILALTGLAILLTWRVTRSPFGRSLRALRDKPEALEAVGKNTKSYQVAVWAVSGAIAGLAGGLYAAVLAYIDPTVFLVTFSFNVLVYIGVGGLASVVGSVLGPILLIAFTESLRFAQLPSSVSGPIQEALFGILLIVLMLFRRGGLVGDYELHE